MCDCFRSFPPAFVKDDYYCESGTNGHPMQGIFYTSDPLWDGQGCPIDNECCAQMGIPKFYRKTQDYHYNPYK